MLDKAGHTMLTRDDALSLILQKTEDTMKKFGFSVVTPAGAQKGDLPVFEDGEHTYMDFTGEKANCALRFSARRRFVCGRRQSGRRGRRRPYQNLHKLF